jgi:membrane fusion protein, multidrug efflux system
MNAWESRVVLGGMAVAMALALAGCGRQAEHPTSAPPKVTVTEPEQRAVLEYEELPGRVAAIDHVVVKARVTGYLNKVHFQEGAEVREGDLLYTIDPREYQAEFASAEAALQQSQAETAQAHSDYQRSMQLSTQKVIAAQETEKQGTAALAAEAGTRSAQARLAKAKLDLEYTEIRSPVSGKISRTSVTEGNLVANGDTLTTIVSQDPVYVYFDAPERVVLRWDKAVGDEARRGLTARARAFVGLLNEEGFPREGTVDFSDNEVSAGTGTLKMRAVVPNDDRRLRIGMFARVRLTLDQPRPTLLVPERAVGVDQGQRFTYVVNGDNKVEYRKVLIGQVYDGKLAILEGLQPDDRVITEGLQLLRPGQVVQPEVAPGGASQPVTGSETPESSPTKS